MPIYNVTQIYFGRYSQLDTMESGFSDRDIDNEQTESRVWRAGAVFNESNLQLVRLRPINESHASGTNRLPELQVDDDERNHLNRFQPDKVSYTLDGREYTETLDSSFTWNATLTTGGGKSEPIRLSLIQLRNGDIFSTENSDLDSKDIVSIRLDSHFRGDFIGTKGGLNIDNARIACFTAGTQIMTADGERPIEELAAGDMVLTVDAGFQPIRWIGSRKIRSPELACFSKLRPIRIRAGALGDARPAQDLLVSQQHRILLRGLIQHKMFNSYEILVAAKHLLALDGVEMVDDLVEVEYFHMLLDRHQIVWSNSAASETLYAGGEAIKALPKSQLDEIYRAFPQLQEIDNKNIPADSQFAPARIFINGRQGKNIAARLLRNGKKAYSEAV